MNPSHAANSQPSALTAPLITDGSCPRLDLWDDAAMLSLRYHRIVHGYLISWETPSQYD